MLVRLLLVSLFCSCATSSFAFTLLTYNVKGNGATDWSTNATQVQAIGREVMYLQPDIITFNEIPNPYTYQMTNFVAAYLPGYFLATNSATDTFIRSVIASRYPITRSTSWLHGSSLAAFGGGNYNFARDLFEAQITVPGFAQPLHVFTTHLKCCSDPTSGIRRAAEAGAISNFFATGFLTTNASRPYVLTGDLNEDIYWPDSTNQPIQRLISPPTGLQLTTPNNLITHTDLTLSIQTTLDVRFDYILPGSLLFSNIAASQVFRTDLLVNPPPPLRANDDATASDHLPVLMTFNSPYDVPFRLLSINRSNQAVILRWESASGRQYRVDASSNLTGWVPFASNLTATGTNFSLTSNVQDNVKFFRVYRSP